MCWFLCFLIFLHSFPFQFFHFSFVKLYESNMYIVLYMMCLCNHYAIFLLIFFFTFDKNGRTRDKI